MAVTAHFLLYLIFSSFYYNFFFKIKIVIPEKTAMLKAVKRINKKFEEFIACFPIAANSVFSLSGLKAFSDDFFSVFCSLLSAFGSLFFVFGVPPGFWLVCQFWGSEPGAFEFFLSIVCLVALLPANHFEAQLTSSITLPLLS